MKLKQIMRSPVVTIPADTCISQVAKEMVRTGYGFLPVMDHGRVVGVVTGKDLATRAAARGLGLDSANVTVIMSFPPLCLPCEDDLYIGLEMMRTHGVRRILILDGQGEVTGIVSLSDIEAAISSQIVDELQHVEVLNVERKIENASVLIPGLYLG